MKKSYEFILVASLLYFTANVQWGKTNGPEGMTVASVNPAGQIILQMDEQPAGK